MKWYVFLLSLLLCVYGAWSHNTGPNAVKTTEATTTEGTTTEAPEKTATTPKSPAPKKTTATAKSPAVKTTEATTTEGTTTEGTTTEGTTTEGTTTEGKTTEGKTAKGTTAENSVSPKIKAPKLNANGVHAKRNETAFIINGFKMLAEKAKNNNITLPLKLLETIGDVFPTQQAPKRITTTTESTTPKRTTEPTKNRTTIGVTTTTENRTTTGPSTSPPKTVKNRGPKPANRTPDSSHFAVVFLVMIAILFGLYALYHNRQKIIAVVVEGRSGNGRGGRDRYRKLDNESLEPEARIKNSNEVYVY